MSFPKGNIRGRVLSCETARVFEACFAAFVSKLTLGMVPSCSLKEENCVTIKCS